MEGVGEHPVRLNEGIRVREALSCLLCDSKGTLLYQNLRDCLFDASGTWTLMRCPKCGLVWLNPRPVPQDIGKLYEQYFTRNAAKCVSLFPGVKRIIRDAVLASCLGYNTSSGPLQKALGKSLSWIGPIREMVELSVMKLNGQRKGKLLDVGCGSGHFLAKMRELGWEVAGVEPAGQAVKVAKERFGLSVYEGTLEEVNFPDDTFDAITMHQVIEHVWDPMGTLQECRRVLKSSGRLVIVTPNIKSLGDRLFREAWRGLEVPRHLYLFSPCTLRVCAEQAGLQVKHLYTTARSARWIWAASRLIHRNGILPGGSPKKQGLWLRLEGLAFQVVEHGLCWVRDAGEELVLIATK